MASACQMFGLANIANLLSSKILPNELVSADSDLGGFPWELLELAYQPLETHRSSGLEQLAVAEAMPEGGNPTGS